MRLTIILSLLITALNLNAQTWEVQTLAPMPEARANNAVATATANGVRFVYSFSGIDNTKLWSGINNKSFRYAPQFNLWETIPDLPMSLNIIAAGASTVKNKIYIIGGYEVRQNGSEVSSNQTFEYNPATSQYTEMAEIPKAIDDQVQAVWRDSLIYVITGWSNTTNVTDVQIFNPTENTWEIGTPVPNNADYKVFGGSGEIIGDTIYYAGGTGIIGNNFQLVPFLRKGVINPNSPTEIEWLIEENDLALGYRMGATIFNNTVLWLGGSLTSYNYDGIAYNGTGGVPATTRILSYNPNNGILNELNDVLPPTMDLRGVAKLDNNTFIIAGGMENNQTVTDRCYLLKAVELPSSDNEIRALTLNVYPTITNDVITIEFPNELKGNWGLLTITNINGQVITQQQLENNTDISTGNWASGTYFISVINGDKIFTARVVKL